MPARAGFGLEQALAGAPAEVLPAEQTDSAGLGRLFDGYLAEAARLAGSLRTRYAGRELKTTEQDLVPFVFMDES